MFHRGERNLISPSAGFLSAGAAAVTGMLHALFGSIFVILVCPKETFSMKTSKPRAPLSMRFPGVVAGILAAACLVSGASVAQAQVPTKYNWRLTTFVPEGSSDFRNAVQVFVDNVHAITDGEVRIQAFGAGVLAGPFEGPKAVQDGIADLTYFFPAFLVNQDPTNAIFAGMPGGMSSEATLHWIFQSGADKIWTDFRREKMDLHSIVAGAGPTEKRFSCIPTNPFGRWGISRA
jgi:hypothetical protein